MKFCEWLHFLTLKYHIYLPNLSTPKIYMFKTKFNVSVSLDVHMCAPLQSHIWLFWDPMDSSQDPLSTEFSSQEYWSGLPFPPPGDHPDPEMEPVSPALQANSLPLSHLGSPCLYESSYSDASILVAWLVWSSSHQYRNWGLQPWTSVQFC